MLPLVRFSSAASRRALYNSTLNFTATGLIEVARWAGVREARNPDTQRAWGSVFGNRVVGYPSARLLSIVVV